MACNGDAASRVLKEKGATLVVEWRDLVAAAVAVHQYCKVKTLLAGSVKVMPSEEVDTSAPYTVDIRKTSGC